ncbi:MAG: cyclic nucleotide-binding domain-containing protein [Lentisphaeraceae bacterium]|nr:cyclic nucleotide-binding domain-containing protein [Lentisphaeraceae bacterium]
MTNKEKNNNDTVEFPHDIHTYKPYHENIEVFDRASDNPAYKYSLKASEEKFCTVSEDEKFAFELMDGKKTVDEIAAVYLEEKGAIALTMIRRLTVRLWQEGMLSDSVDTPKSKEVSSEKRLKLPGLNKIGKFSGPILGHLFTNPLSLILFLGIGIYGAQILSEVYSDPTKGKSLFAFKNNTNLGFVVLFLTLFGASLTRFLIFSSAIGKLKLGITSAGLSYNNGFGGLYLSAPSLTTLTATKRFWVRLSGLIICFGLFGIFLTIEKHTKLSPDTATLLFQIGFYLLLYCLYHCCPMINSDLYVACSDYLDEKHLRKSSVSFVQNHIQSFFSPAKKQSGDTVIYIMYCAGTLLWVAGTAQLLLLALAQNSKIISGIFDNNKEASAYILPVLFLLPIFIAICISSYLFYRFIVKSVTSIKTFKVSKNMIMLAFGMTAALLLLLRATDQNTRSVIYHIIIIGATILATKYAWSLKKKFTASPFKAYLTCMAIFSILLLGNFLTIKVQAWNNYTWITSALLAATLLIATLSHCKLEWSEFIKSKLDSFKVSILLTICLALLWMVNSYLQNLANTDIVMKPGDSFNSIEFSRIVGLYGFIALSLSLVLSIPTLVYKRNTEQFAPAFAIIFASHLLLYFSIISILGFSEDKLWESFTATAVLLLIGIESLKFTQENREFSIPPFPFGISQNELNALTAGFDYTIKNSLNSIEKDFGPANTSYITRSFKEYNQKLSLDWDLNNIPVSDTSINNLGEVYKNTFGKFKQLSINCCGFSYINALLTEIEDHLHTQAKEVIEERIGLLEKKAKSADKKVLSESDKRQLVSQTIFFEGIEGDELKKLLSCLHTATYDIGDVLIKQHDKGDRLFILAEGHAQIELENLAGHSQIIAHISKNEFFGEVALIKDIPRTATVRATQPCLALYLKKVDFDNFLKSDEDKKDKILSTLNYLRLIKSIPLFKELDTSVINLLAGKMKQENFDKGKTIITQGDEGNKFYIVLEGDCRVHVDRDDQKDHEVAILSKGEYFGEIALIKDIPRTASVTVVSERGLVLSLEKQDFKDVINSHELLHTNFANASHRRIVEMMH